MWYWIGASICLHYIFPFFAILPCNKSFIQKWALIIHSHLKNTDTVPIYLIVFNEILVYMLISHDDSGWRAHGMLRSPWRWGWWTLWSRSPGLRSGRGLRRARPGSHSHGFSVEQKKRIKVNPKSLQDSDVMTLELHSFRTRELKLVDFMKDLQFDLRVAPEECCKFILCTFTSSHIYMFVSYVW